MQITWGVGGVMVSIVAFQAVDLGSIPGQRSSFLTKCSFWNNHRTEFFLFS